MEYTTLGKTGVKISRICLGCMTFGDKSICKESPYLLNQEQTDEVIKKALDLGINFFDTANCYARNTSEIYLGNSLKKFCKNRSEIVVATKVFNNEGHLSKEAILREIEGSLKRLQMDYIDLYIIHRWDYDTPIEETMETLHSLVKAGKVKYLGASSMYSYQFYKAQECARQHGWTPFISMQNHYNLLYREEEREMMPLLEEEGVVMTPWSPLAGGKLCRLWNETSPRQEVSGMRNQRWKESKDIDEPIVKRVKELADKYKVSMAEVAGAWILSKPLVAAPIIGVTKLEHLEQSVNALKLKLTQDDINYLEELYRPHPVIGNRPKPPKMDYVILGKSKMKVSRICLGCVTFGDKEVCKEQPYLLDQDQTDKVVKRALDLGINFFDVANCYGQNTSEIYLGNSLKKFARRDKIFIATKVYFNEGHLSKEAILKEIEGSLKRLQTDYIDLYIIHRWDYDTPIEETMETLHSLVKAGKVKYLGASAMFSYQFYKAQECARQHGWTPFISMQNHYNLIYREEEREMIQLLEEEEVPMTPYSPLAGGRLCREWESDSLRSKNDQMSIKKYDSNKELDMPIVLRVKEIAAKYKVSMSQVAISWLLSKNRVASPIVGVTKVTHLEDACKAIRLKLNEEDIKYLEELYKPHNVVGALKKPTK